MGFFATDNLDRAESGETECTPRNAYRAFRVQELGLRSYSPELGRWVNRDPIGDESFLERTSRGRPLRDRRRLWWAARAPLLVFNENDPFDRIDVNGLATYACAFYYVSGGAGLGGGVLNGTCTSQCDEHNKYYHKFKVRVLLFGATFGILPVGGEMFNLTLETDDEQNQPHDLAGPAVLFGAGLATPIWGASTVHLTLGEATTGDPSIPFDTEDGEQWGIDAPNADFFVGWSRVKDITKRCCPDLPY